MKNLIFFLFFNLSFAQYCKVDKALIKVVQETPKSEAKYAKTLVDYFKTKAKTPKELFTLNYLWIVMNIKYDYDFVRDETGKVPAPEYAPYKIITTRKTVCEGFANLLKQLCDLSGIKSEMVAGYAKGGNYFLDGNIITQSNHKWNVIFLNNKWQLVDVTWDANHFDWNGDYFFKQGKLKYISMKPEIFLLTHFPDDKKWQLVKKPMSATYFFSFDWEDKKKLQSDLLTKEFFNDSYIEEVKRDPKLK